MSDYTRSTVSTINGVNAETQKIQIAVNSKLDKSGGAFTGTVDMNEQRLINLPDATDPSEAMPLGQGLAIQQAAQTAAEEAAASAATAQSAIEQMNTFPVDGALAGALALPDSEVLVGNVKAGNLSKRTLGTWVTDYSHLVVGGDWSAAFQAAADAAGVYNTINVPAGEFTVGDVDLFMCSLVGAGTLSLIKKKAGASFCIRYNNPGNWEFGQIRNLGFDGVTSFNGDGVVFGAPDGGSQLFPGRLDFIDVSFTRFDKPIHKPFGNIGNSYIRCSFSLSNFCVYAKGDTVGMHVGNDVIDRCHLGSGIAKACLYYDNSGFDGFGQLVVRDTIVEGNGGAGILLRNTGNPFSGVVFDNVWFEANTQNANVTIDGEVWSTADYILDNAQDVTIKNSFVKSYRLFRSSTLLLDNCRVDPLTGTYVAERSTNSSVESVNQLSLSQYNDPLILTRSARAVNSFSSEDNTLNSVFRMPHLDTRVYHYGNRKTQHYGGDTAFTVSGPSTITSEQVLEGNLYAKCAKFIIPAGNQYSIDTYDIPPGKWIVWSASVKGTGTVAILPDGDNSIIRGAEVPTSWCTYKSCFFGFPTQTVRFYVQGGSLGGDFWLRELQWVAFDTKQEAWDFLNSHTFVYN